MSKTTTIAFGDRWFWSYDLARSVLLVEVIKVARSTAGPGDDRWADEVLDDLRLYAEISDFDFVIDPVWGQRRLDAFVEWLEEANTSLGTREAVGPEETADWPLEQFEWRGTTPISTEAVISLGTAVIQLIRGALPTEPLDKIWCYGFTPEPILISTTFDS
ncbi:hypothetical protein F4561_000257 [Lipingzhangella halophila]|uniref:Uncharacterized protein n=1 Tax=Lipingzhangella halophila TaxID=1783352 RepID=A0A7W7RCG0_9ACTN|nr:hypothetical protein [Lipingzhangella halophila]MBB4929437.1 hypothetical protein [Lipingzhangella halophila]